MRERHVGKEDIGDSNGSESDAGLVATVTGMRVQCHETPAPRPALAPAPALAELLAALAPALPGAARSLLLSPHLARTLSEVLRTIRPNGAHLVRKHCAAGYSSRSVSG